MVSTIGILAQRETTKHCLTLFVASQSPLYVSTQSTRRDIYTVKQTPGRREGHLLIDTSHQRNNVMPRGRLSKVEIEPKIYDLFHELDKEQGEKGLTYKYLHKVLDILEEYSS